MLPKQNQKKSFCNLTENPTLMIDKTENAIFLTTCRDREVKENNLL